MTVEAKIRALEARRCKALVDRDIATLDGLIADDLVHIHGNGGIDDKAGYLRGVEEKYDFHKVDRGNLVIRIYGDVVVVTGALVQSFSLKGADERHEIAGMSTQVWVSTSAGWRQTTCHNQFLPGK